MQYTLSDFYYFCIGIASKIAMRRDRLELAESVARRGSYGISAGPKGPFITYNHLKYRYLASTKDICAGKYY